MFKSEIVRLIKIEGVTDKEIEDALIAQADDKNGDYSLPCFKFSRQLKKAPDAIAKNLCAGIKADFIDKAEAAGGYLNIYINKKFFAAESIRRLLKQEDIGASDIGKGLTICIDYSSINIAKPFHIGHLSSTVIGGALYRIFKKLGYNVVGINHLGDWGTQFGKLIYAYKNWSCSEEIEKGGIRALLNLYVRFHDEAECDPALDAAAREWFLKIEKGDREALEIFHKFRDITLIEANRTYEQLNIKFDSYNGESFFNDKMDAVLDTLSEKGLLLESDGAKIVSLEEYKMPPCLIQRSDGASLYATRDIAAAVYRKKEYDFHKCLYIVAYQQNLHFSQVFKVVELMGYEWAKDLVHVPFGMVSLEEGTLSTRRGNVVFLQDVLDKAVEKTARIIEEKNPGLTDRQKRAEEIGRGAVIYSALMNQRIKDVTFSYDRVLSFEGESGPYIQYTHARANSVLNKAGQAAAAKAAAAAIAELSGIDDEHSITLIKLLNRFDGAVIDAAEKYEPSVISKLLIDICQAFNKFYIENRILDAEEGVRNSRLVLTMLTKRVIAAGLDLLLMAAPEEM